jgi:hypothetical protein
VNQPVEGINHLQGQTRLEKHLTHQNKQGDGREREGDDRCNGIARQLIDASQTTHEDKGRHDVGG